MGGYGDDRIISSGGNDTLKGGLGDDFIEVGEGDDLIYGDDKISSGGKDTFVFTGQFGNDTIEDFEINNDFLFLREVMMIYNYSRGFRYKYCQN